MNWNEAFRRILGELETRMDSFVSQRREISRPIVVPYRGFGTRRSVWLSGRVLDDPGIGQTLGGSRQILGQTREMWRRFASREIAGARVEVSIGSSSTETTTDDEGYFDLELETRLHDQSLWHEYHVRLIDPPPSDDAGGFPGSVLVPPSTARVGIISDIDDTVIDSSATDRMKMLRTLLFTAAEARLPFEGIADLFQALLRTDEADNPVFYVSSSPWNLYDFLVGVLEIHGLPSGPMMLQDFGLDEDKLIHAPHDRHKLAQIARIIGTYPDLEWILVGDSGQRDPEIYKAVAEEVPERVRAIIIRDVTTRQREAVVREILAPLAARGIPLGLVQNADEARTLLEQAGVLEPSGTTR